MPDLLQIDGLAVSFRGGAGDSEVVRDLSLTVRAGEKVALVGESGSGKSVTAMSVLRLHDESATAYRGRILFDGADVLGFSPRQLQGLRGRDVSMIFQEPMSSLNPVYPVGEQLMEPLMRHRGMGRAEARERMIDLLGRVGIPEPQRRFDAFPHMLSGGQRQRVMIAMALACNPKLLIADEPTTALDVTIQKQILELLDELQREFDMAVLMITHDLNMVRGFADRIGVMQAGRLVEEASTEALFTAPRHEYTRHLLASQPEPLVDGDEVGGFAAMTPVMRGRRMRCVFPVKAGFFRRRIGEVRALDGVDLDLRPGETVGIVGESGSGKTTLGMCLLRLQDCEGEISYEHRRLDVLSGRRLRPLRRNFQVVFQDPFSSLSPRMNVEQLVGEGLQIHFPELDRSQRRQRIIEVLEEVGLDASMLGRYPHEFSGGQRQRIAIARAVVLEPKVILLDEPTSALDVSVQKQVLALLRRLQQRHSLSYLFISHDLKVVRSVAHRVLVMRDGVVVESGATATIFSAPQHPYTRLLLEAALFSEAG